MEGVAEARQDARARQTALHLTQAMQQPLGDVSARSGQIERDSPLFYGSGAGTVLMTKDEFIQSLDPEATVYAVAEVDMRAVDAYQATMPNGEIVKYRALTDSRHGNKFLEYEESYLREPPYAR